MGYMKDSQNSQTIEKRRIVPKGEIVHVLNRGVDQRKIFLDKEDYFRFTHDLFEFNDVKPAQNLGRRFLKDQHSQVPSSRQKPETELSDLRSQSVGGSGRVPRKLIVEILAFSLIRNHFHLLLRQIREGGIAQFMRKLGGGYANYFNQKYQRSGALFQGRYKMVLVKREAHFLHLPYYIHFNPLDLSMPEWRKGKIKNYRKAITSLETYRWSSHPDYIGKKNFPSVTQREFLLKIFGGSKAYKEGVERWLKAMNLEAIKELTLD